MKKLSIIVLMLLFALSTQAQGELAATLEVLNAGVEVRRVNTANWIALNVEAIVGVGDRIRTDDTGRARITFFADGTETELLPNTEFHINGFSGSETQFNISVEIIIGQTIQRLNRLIDARSSYDITTPGMGLVARGTAFDIRVEDNGRSAMLVREGLVAAADEQSAAEVSAGFGVRSETDAPLSDVVRADTFDQLDAALDGCAATLTTPDDVSINVRLAPNLNAPVVGGISADEIALLFGRTESSGWYRIAYRGSFGWILSSSAVIGDGCAGLRTFPDDFAGEDPALYEFLGTPLTLDDLSRVPVTPPVEATPEATPEAEVGA